MTRRSFKNLVAAREKLRREAMPKPVDMAVTASSSGTSPSTSSPIIDDKNSSASDPVSSVDILEMSAIERKALAQGSHVRVVQCGKIVAQFPRRLFLAASTKGPQFLDGNDNISLPDEINVSSIRYFIGWVHGTTKKLKVSKLRTPVALAEAMDICRVADTLGMTKYVQHIIWYHKMKIVNEIPTNDDMRVVEEQGSGSSDQFLHFVADRIAFLVRKGLIQDMKDYLAMAEQFPRLANAWHTINAPWEQRQQAKKEAIICHAQHQRVAEDKKASHSQKQSQRQAAVRNKELRNKEALQMERRRTAEMRDALIQKLKQKVVVLTSEEIELASYLKARGDRAFLTF